MAYSIQGMQNLMNRLERMNFTKSIKSSCEALADEMVEDMQNNILTIKPNAPIDTGELYDSCKSSVIATGDRVVLEVTNSAPHAKYVEFGTGPKGSESPHELGKGYKDEGWVYKNEKDGKFYYTEGQPAKPFIYPTFKKYEDIVTKKIGADLRTDLGLGGIRHGRR